MTRICRSEFSSIVTNIPTAPYIFTFMTIPFLKIFKELKVYGHPSTGGNYALEKRTAAGSMGEYAAVNILFNFFKASTQDFQVFL